LECGHARLKAAGRVVRAQGQHGLTHLAVRFRPCVLVNADVRSESVTQRIWLPRTICTHSKTSNPLLNKKSASK